MKLPSAALHKLVIDEHLREAIERARAVKANIARRRAERTLAGALRRIDLGELAAQLAAIQEPGADVQELHLAEQWRTRLIDEGITAAATFPGGADEQLPRLVEAAQRERTTGGPPGAARALFRHLVTRLRSRPR